MGGLILAGLGRGLSQAADTFGSAMNKSIDSDRKRQEQIDDRSWQEAAEQRKAMMLEKIKTDARVNEVAEINKGVSSFVDATKAENPIANEETFTAEQRAVRDRGMGLIGERSRPNVAAELGYMDTAGKLQVIQSSQDKTASDERRLNVDELRVNNKAEHDAAETKRKENADRGREAAAEARTLAVISRIAGSGGGDKSEKVMTYMDARRKEIASEASNLKAAMAAEMRDAFPEEKAKIKEAYQPMLDAIAESRKQMDDDFKHLRKKFDLPPAREDAPPPPKPTVLAMPKTKAELKSGSIYQTSRGPAKWDGTNFEAQ